ncbi:nitroreductase family protein [Cellulophaga baltica]|uniref:nitroreductase family protein n=1 Tax=Cellulophaga TaxID=104264 RepID=UPI001C06FB2F|nr:MULTISPECIES: nitroreductase family protein [Cellulophaga]MBU2997730.1 nitroreductase family protein [Cellulophaga baltica]MDO6769125.1 nitroreductase family protein [Cellulophaga sp. 1_MG-2023]
MNISEQIQLENIAACEYEIFALLKQRYSPRTFKEASIKQQHINQIFEAARWSASSNNIQPWRFIYAERNTPAYDKILSCLNDFNREWATNAPLLMLTAYKEETEDGVENFHALHDLGFAIGSMTMQAQYMGIALHSMAGVDWEKAQDVFNVPEGYHIASAIAVGYYGGEIEKLSEELQEQEINERKRIRQRDFAFKEQWD